MSKRTVAILLAAFLVLLVLVTVGRRESASPAGTGAPLIAGLDDALGDIERVTVTKANGETVATLEKGPDNWVVSDKHGYVANAGKLRQALTALGEARILEQKTANAELYSRLGVEDVAGADATGITVALTAAGRELPTVILGNAEGAKFRYARRAGEAQSFLIDRNPDVPRAAGQWVESQIVDIRSDRVREVTITHPDGETLRIAKTAPELANFEVAGVPNGRELSYPGVANVSGNALRELNLEDVEPADASPAGEATQVELKTFDGLVVKILGVERDNESWITIEASADSAQAPATPPPAAQPAADGAAPATPAAADPSAEAARINARVGGWRYKIAGFQYDQLTRRMADLLKAPPAP